MIDFALEDELELIRNTARARLYVAALEATILGMDLLEETGGRGDHLIEKLFRDVKAMDIVEGTGQIQRILMARHLVDLPSERGGA